MNFFGKSAVIFILSAIPAAFLFLYHDPTRHYLWVPDFDIGFVYQALRINAGLAPEVVGSYGFGLYFAIAKWLQVSQFLGLIEHVSIDAILASTNGDVHVQRAVELARWMTLSTVVLAISGTAFLCLLLTRSFILAICCVLILSGSQSILTFTIIIRPEVMSLALAIWGLIAMCLAIQVQSRAVGLGLSILSGALLAFSIHTKLASLPVIIFFPLIVLSIAMSSNSFRASASENKKWIWLSLIALMIAAAPAYIDFIDALTAKSIVLNLLLIGFGAGVFFIAARYARSEADYGVVMIGGVLAGVAYLHYAVTTEGAFFNTVTFVNHIQFLSLREGQPFSNDFSWEALGQGSGIASILGKVVLNIIEVFERSFFQFCWVCRRFAIIYFLLFLTAIYIVVRKKHRACHVIYALLALIIFAEAVLRIHSYNNFYRHYIEAFVVIAFLFGIAHITRFLTPRRKTIALSALVIFSLWFTTDDIRRKLVTPAFASQIGEGCFMVKKYASELQGYSAQYCTEPRPEITPWTVDSRRSFMGSDAPWRLMTGQVWEYMPIHVPGRGD